MGVSVKVAIDPGKLERIVDPKRVAQVKALLVDRVAEDANYIVPYDTGNLHDTMRKDADGVRWPAGYASYVHDLDAVRPGKNPENMGGSKAKWAQAAIDEHELEWAEMARRELLR